MRQRTVKELLLAAKEAAELMLDLAYAAIFFDDRTLAREVVRLESRVGETLTELRTVCMIASRTREDAQQLAGVLATAVAIEGIADAADEIAQVVARDLGVPSQLREDLRLATEVTARIRVGEGSELAGRTLEDAELPTRTGMWVIAIRHEDEWVFDPAGEVVLRVEDLLFVQGPREGVDLVRTLTGSTVAEPAPPPPGPALSDLDRAVDLVVELKQVSEVAVGLAYAAILLDELALAHEVAGIEATSDRLFHDLELWVLRAAADVEDPEELRGLLHLASASERIVDAARSMCRIVEDEGETHPIIADALAEGYEIAIDVQVGAGCEAEGRTFGELRLHARTGMDVIAVQRAGRWQYRPARSRTVEAGDRLIAIGPSEGAVLLRGLCGDDRPAEDLGFSAE
jgi:uncharacterized protein with PhoU and TrkA domain